MRVALVVVVVVAAVATWIGVRGRPSRSAPVAAVEVAPPALAIAPAPMVVRSTVVAVAGPNVVITEVHGRVEHMAAGTWRAAAAGDALAATDRLRTGPDGEATLAVAEVGTVVLAPRSDFEVGRRTRQLMSLQLGRGRLHAELGRGAGMPLRIAIRDSDAVAESRDGAFSVLSAGTGAVAVATERGTVDVTAAARTVAVGAGAYSVIAPGAAPSTPRTIPPSLFLKIAHGPQQVTTREIAVSGLTAPGAVVTVTAARVTVTTAGIDGRFTARVALVEGSNRVAVEAVDPTGRTARDQLPVIVDTTPPGVEAEVRW